MLIRGVPPDSERVSIAAPGRSMTYGTGKKATSENSTTDARPHSTIVVDRGSIVEPDPAAG